MAMKAKSGRKEANVAKRSAPKKDRGITVPAEFISAEHGIEENTRIHPELVIVDFEQARIPRSEAAKRVRAMAKGDAVVVESVKRSKGGSGVVFEINPYDLNLEAGWNRRNFDTAFRRQRIAGWGVSIAKVGLREPLVCHIKDGKVYVHSGWNRWFATIYAIEVEGKEIQRIPVRFGKGAENDADWNLSQLVNNGSDPLEPLEQAYVIRDQINVFGWKRADVADAIGKSETNVQSLLDLLTLPQAILNFVRNGKISVHMAKLAYGEARENEGKTVANIETALTTAASRNRDHAMPMDLPGRQRKTRAKEAGRTSSRSTDRDAVLVEILRTAVITRVEGGRNIFVNDNDYAKLAASADLPADDEVEVE